MIVVINIIMVVIVMIIMIIMNFVIIYSLPLMVLEAVERLDDNTATLAALSRICPRTLLQHGTVRDIAQDRRALAPRRLGHHVPEGSVPNGAIA